MRKSTLSTKGELPQGWRWVRLGEVIAEALPGFATGERDPHGVIQLRMNNVDTGGRLIWDEFIRVPVEQKLVARFRLTAGDVVFNNTNSVELVGKSAVFTGHAEPVVFSNHFTRLRSKADRLDSGYLGAWLLSQWQSGVFERLCNRWIGQSAVKCDRLLALEIPLPPLSVQKRIAAILNEQMAVVQRASAVAQVQFDAANALPASYLREVFPRSGQELPGGWSRVKLGEILRVRSGEFLPASQMDPGGPFPVYGGNGITGFHNAYMFEEPRVIIGRVGALCGCIHITEPRSWVTDNALYVEVTQPPMDLKFLYYCLTQLDLRCVANQMGQPVVSGKSIYEVCVSLPPILDQKAIAARLDGQLAAAERLREQLRAQMLAVNALPAAVLRRAFAGEL